MGVAGDDVRFFLVATGDVIIFARAKVAGTTTFLSLTNLEKNEKRYHVLEFRDSLEENIVPFIAAAKNFIDQSLASNPNSRVLVQGLVGMNRSAAVCTAYVSSNTLTFRAV